MSQSGQHSQLFPFPINVGFIESSVHTSRGRNSWLVQAYYYYLSYDTTNIGRPSLNFKVVFRISHWSFYHAILMYLVETTFSALSPLSSLPPLPCGPSISSDVYLLFASLLSAFVLSNRILLCPQKMLSSAMYLILSW